MEKLAEVIVGNIEVLKLIENIKHYSKAVAILEISDDPKAKRPLIFYRDKLDQSIKEYIKFLEVTK